MASTGTLNVEAATAQVKRLINTQLKQVLKGIGLPVSGAKAVMQTRIINQLQQFAEIQDVEGFNRTRNLIYNPSVNAAGLSPSPSTARLYQSSAMLPHGQSDHPFHSTLVRPGPPLMPTNVNGSGPRTPQFKSSPFYQMLQPLTPVLECKVRESTRDTINAAISLPADVAERLNRDPATRAMIYCSADSLASPFTKVDIEFPHQIEIKINQDEVKSNLRGLKKKSGSTRPADITQMLRKRAGYENQFVATYALTQKKYYLVVWLVKQGSPEELVSKLQAGKKISKEQVIREMVSKADDSDIVATSSIMSLKCPLSTLRIDIPCRSIQCSHNQCFDALSFLQLQEQAPTWTCPICNKAANFDHLEMDRYFDDILKSTPRSVEQVTIEPDGKWSVSPGNDASPKLGNGRASSDDEDDLVEIRDMPQIASVKSEATGEAGMMTTPPCSSREQSDTSAPPAPSSSGSKRPAGDVVDLTQSSDEDDESPRGPKRQVTHKSSSGLVSLPRIENVPLRPNGITSGLPKQTARVNPFPTSNYTNPSNR